MTCRMKNGRNPIRIVLDTNLKTPKNSKIYNNDGAKVIIITSHNVSNEKINNFPSNIKILKCKLKNNKIDLKEALKLLYNEGIRSILVESGAKLNNSFIEEHLADKLVQFIAPKILSDKNSINFSEGFMKNNISECYNLNIVSTKKLKNDIIIV